MKIETINPYNLNKIATYTTLDSDEIVLAIEKAHEAFLSWRNVAFDQRATLIKHCAQLLIEEKETLARTMTMEMGKPIGQSLAEIEKCAWVCEYYAGNGQSFLTEEKIQTDAGESWVSYESMGVILAIMPWNFPFWQVFRFLVPTLLAGNTALLKHAPNVMGCARLIEELIDRAGFPDGVFQNLVIGVGQVPQVLEHRYVHGVSLTGSEKAGASVAATAASQIKKSLLELGGSNAFIVLNDADLEEAVLTGVNARMQNNGQSCIAAKRFMIQDDIYEQFLESFREKLENYVEGDPIETSTTLGPLARIDLAEKLEKQVNQSVEMGANLLMGGNRKGAFYEPSILTDVTPGMPAFDEELFGPAAAFMKFNSLKEAIDLSNKSRFGLGVTVFTGDPHGLKPYIKDFEDGAVFVNEMVKSDPRLPFGGTKQSGFGRELGKHGIREFVNVKTVYIK